MEQPKNNILEYKWFRDTLKYASYFAIFILLLMILTKVGYLPHSGKVVETGDRSSIVEEFTFSYTINGEIYNATYTYSISSKSRSISGRTSHSRYDYAYLGERVYFYYKMSDPSIVKGVNQNFFDFIGPYLVPIFIILLNQFAKGKYKKLMKRRQYKDGS